MNHGAHAGTPIIHVENLWKTYRSVLRRERIPAVCGIELEVRPGEIFGFLGPNGAGKTTTVKLLLGLLKPDRGRIRVLSEPPGSLAAKKRLGYMPERSLLPPYLRLDEMVRLFGGLSGLRGKQLEQAVARSIAAVDLQEAARRTLDGFSKGMLQRASLAQALVADPELLLLDEPAIGLDPVARHRLRELLRSLRAQGKTIFLNSHELEVVQQICDRFAILNKGEIVAVEPIRALHDANRYVITLGPGAENPLQLVQDLSAPSSWDAERRALTVTCHDLDHLNRLIDALRTGGARIAALTPHTITLETLFLRYMEQAPARAEALK